MSQQPKTPASPTAADTAKNLIDLSTALSDLQRWLDDFSRANLDPRSKEAQTILRRESDLASDAAEMQTVAAHLLVADIANALPKIKQATDQLKQVQANIDKLGKVLHLAAAALTATAAIVGAVASGGATSGTALSAIADFVESVANLGRA